MAAEPGEEALHWGDEHDPSHVASGDAAAPARDATGAIADRVGADTAPPTNSALLVGYGILAGIYLLFCVGWIIAAVRNPTPVSGPLAVIMYEFGQFLAIVAGPLWAGAVLVLTRSSRTLVRVLLLVLGILLLIPWPFIVAS